MTSRLSALIVFGCSSLFYLSGCIDSSAPEDRAECLGEEKSCPSGQVCVDFLCYEMCETNDQCSAGYLCIDNICKEDERACTENEDCNEDANEACVNGACVQRNQLGFPCADSGECESGHCVENVCCVSACSGDCDSCLKINTGGNNGECSPVLIYQDPKDSCDEDLSCDGAGACFAKELGDECDDSRECVSHNCRAGECVETGCGNGVLDDGEECDDGPDNTSNTDDCLSTCRLNACGDGFVHDGEEACDNGTNNSDTDVDACRTNCTTAACGDGVIDSGETCDDNNAIDGDYCAGNCQAVTGVCGDNTIQTNEACDDNNTEDGDYCAGNCQTVTGSCGDGSIQTNEACDDNNTANGDYCAANCQAITGSCGDSTTQTNEVCDDGNVSNETECPYGTPTCSLCANDCQTTLILSGRYCGDTTTDGTYGEVCDDGNSVSETECPYGTQTCSRCSSDCHSTLSLSGAYCGDSNTNGGDGEVCDDGNNSNGDYCQDDCLLITGYCGDTTIQSNEACDDGNTVTETDPCDYGVPTCDGCSSDCTNAFTLVGPYCGDDIKNGDEECDDGTGVNGTESSYCTANCDSQTYVGDINLDYNALVNGTHDDVRRVQGNVTIYGLDLTGAFIQIMEIGLPNLREITGSLSVRNTTDVKNITFSSLKIVGGDVDITAYHMMCVAPCIPVSYFNNDVLYLNFPVLENVGGNIVISENPLLHTIDFDELDDASNVYIVGNPKLCAVSTFPSQASLGAASYTVSSGADCN